MKKLIVYFIPIILFFTLTNAAVGEENLPVSEKPQMPNRLEGTGTHFELKDSNYLNIILDSSQPIKVILESVPEMVTFHIEPVSGANSTQITLSGFLPSTTYYKYEDSYHNLEPFVTDNIGKYTYIQDLLKSHFIFIQPRTSTIFLTDSGWSDQTVGTWDSVTRTATLTTDIDQTVQIDTNNIIFDGNGHIITGTGTGYGIYLSGRSGVIIKNINVRQFSLGIRLSDSVSNSLTSNTISSNEIGIDLFRSNNNNLTDNTTNLNNYDGVRLSFSNNNTLINNATLSNSTGITLSSSNNNNLITNTSKSNNSSGIFVYLSNSNTLTDNTTSDNSDGIYLHGCRDNTLTGNIMSGNKYNFYLHGSIDSDFNNNIDTTNLVDDKPIYYIQNATDQVYNASTNAGAFYCISCNDVTIKDLTLNNNGYGVFLWKTQNSKIENISASNNEYGISLHFSSNNTLIGNHANSKNYYGIYLYLSNNNALISDTANLNNSYGIWLYRANNNILMDNILDSNNNYGISLFFSHNNSITNSTILNNGYQGLRLSASNNNKIYNNNFIDNSTQVYVYGGSGNAFNLDKPIGGNYWSNWVSPDNDGDGFVDNPYVFTGGQDNLPWVKQDGWFAVTQFNNAAPFTIFDLLGKSFSQSILTKTFLSQKASLNNLNITGDLNGRLDFTDLEIIKIDTGSFAGIGFSKGEWQANIEGVVYNGNWKGVTYFVPSERKIYLKGEISGGLNGICEATLSESTTESGIYDKYQAAWKINRLGAEAVSAIINLEGILLYQSTNIFNSEVTLYQANMEGSAYGYYTGPLSAVITHLRLTSENEYLGEGFSIISYNCSVGEGQAYSYNKLTAPGRLEFSGLFEEPLLGRLSAVLDENKSPKIISGVIERLDIEMEPTANLEVITWGPQRISPGQTVDYLIEVRNDGLKIAENTVVIFSLDPLFEYVSSTYSYHNEETNEVIMDLGILEAKGKKIIRVTAKLPWGLTLGTPLENEVRIGTTTKEKDLSYVDTTSWRDNVQPGDIILEHNENSIVKQTGYWTHGGGIVYGTKDEPWTGWREGYFVIEALPNDYRITTNYGGVKTTPIENWDYPFKKEVVVLRIEGLSTEQRDYISNFWKTQVGKPYQYWYNIPPNPNVEDKERYCSELIWAPYYNLGVNLNSTAYEPAITPQEIYDSGFTLSVLGGYYDYRNLNINIHTSSSEVTTARDPNIKYGPEGDVLPGQRLSYKVEYENEGEGIAFGVYFTDTLDEDLDDPTLEIGPVIDVKTGSQIAGPGSYNPKTRTITWFVGEVGSKEGGYAEFNVKVREDTSHGTEVINFATVYFPSVPEATRTNGIANRVVATIDNIPPATTATISSLPNEAGWNNSDVRLTLTAIDNEGGVGVKEIHYRLTGAVSEERIIPSDTAEILLTTEGTTTLTYWAVDNVDNVETAKSLTIKLDKTPPTLTAAISPQPNSFGWNNTDVTVSFTATDSLSGIASVTEPIAVTTEGANQHIGGEAIDLAGNKTTTSITLNIDKTPPEISLELKPINLSDKEDDDDEEDADKSNWYELIYSAEDNLSGLKSIDCGLEVISFAGFKQEFKVDERTEIRIDEENKELKIKAPNPQTVLNELQDGLFNLRNNQVLQLKLKQGKPKWKIKEKSQGNEIQVPHILFKATAVDYSESVSIKELEFDKGSYD